MQDILKLQKKAQSSFTSSLHFRRQQYQLSLQSPNAENIMPIALLPITGHNVCTE